MTHYNVVFLRRRETVVVAIHFEEWRDHLCSCLCFWASLLVFFFQSRGLKMKMAAGRHPEKDDLKKKWNTFSGINQTYGQAWALNNITRQHEQWDQLEAARITTNANATPSLFFRFISTYISYTLEWPASSNAKLQQSFNNHSWKWPGDCKPLIIS